MTKHNPKTYAEWLDFVEAVCRTGNYDIPRWAKHQAIMSALANRSEDAQREAVCSAIQEGLEHPSEDWVRIIP